ncbi:type I toxin-antitoxin system Hok family toxin, partial [Klebsiella pneumoniae]|nr:type I toxin-antitoxin system Hok family toxin [Klebsiella pneumoniae]
MCLTLLIFTYLTRKSLYEIRYRDTNREVAAFLAYESAKQLTPAGGSPRHS